MIFSGLCVRSSHGNNLINLTNFISMKGPLPNKKKMLAIINENKSRIFHREQQKAYKIFVFYLWAKNNSHHYSAKHSKYQTMVTSAYSHNDP